MKNTTQTKQLLKELKKNRVAYVYIAPFFILFLIFGVFPLAFGLYMSFFNWDGFSAPRWVGLKNFIDLFQDKIFWKSLYNTFYIGIISTLFTLGGGLALAYILYSKIIKKSGVFRTIYFLPMVTSTVAISIVFKSIFGYNYGLLNYILGLFHIEKIDWLGGDGGYIKMAIIIIIVWKWIGYNMVIYLTGMQGISSDIIEAAKIDGANHRQILQKVIMPLLKPIIYFTLVNSTIGMINLYSEPFIVTGGLGGGSNSEGMTAMMYLLSKAPQGNNLYGYASACAYVLSFMIILITLVNNRINNRKEKEENVCSE